jgi:TfoX/Sxy family transcriptional regulator of competence genes
MAYNEDLAVRTRRALDRTRGVVERRMFGGVAFLVNGNMSVGVQHDDLVVRIAPEAADEALKEPGVRPFDVTGRPMRGWLLVGAAGTAKPASLGKWVRRGVKYASGLPKKK